jgi:predicted transcriptional regulator
MYSKNTEKILDMIVRKGNVYFPEVRNELGLSKTTDVVNACQVLKNDGLVKIKINHNLQSNPPFNNYYVQPTADGVDYRNKVIERHRTRRNEKLTYMVYVPIGTAVLSSVLTAVILKFIIL